MVHKSKKLTAVYALIMDLPLSILITLISLLLAGNLAAPMFIRMAILAYVITFFVNFLPAPKWGFDFAIKHSKPGTFKFGLLLNIVVAAVFVVILDLIMTAVAFWYLAAAPSRCILFPFWVASFHVIFRHWLSQSFGTDRPTRCLGPL